MSEDNMDYSNQSLIEHLTELRVRLIRSLYALLVMTGITFYFSEKIFEVVRKPIQPHLQGGGLIFTNPPDKFMAHLKLAVVCGVILSCPIWLYHIWKFVAPGLYSKERKYMVSFIISGTLMFLIGVSFSYFIVLPMAFEYLMNFGGNVDKPMISISEYLSFFSQICLMFGAAFELPLILVLLGVMGFVSQQFLREKRRYAVLALAVISAIITPPDLQSMLLMFVPMLFLYEIAVFLVGVVERKRV